MFVEFADLQKLSPILAEAFEYWRSKLGGRPMPSRRDLDPAEMVRLLPWVMLTDVLHSPLDFRFRLIGTGIVGLSRRDYTGHRLSELAHAGPTSQVWKDRERVVTLRQPVLTMPPFTGRGDTVRRVVGVHMPLSNDSASVNMILTAVAYQRY